MNLKPPEWDKYTQMLRKADVRPVSALKKIAILGVPLMDRSPHPLKTAIAEFIAEKEDWQIEFISEAYLDCFTLLSKIPCDGILARVVSPEVAEVARTLVCPLVNISSLVEHTGVNTVRRDDAGLGGLCARHLLELGFTRIGVVHMTPNPGWCFQATMNRFLEVISEGGNVTISSHTIDLTESESSLKARFVSWIQTLQPPAALFVTDDRFAITAIAACQELGIRIPKDLAIISSVQTPQLQPLCQNPTLTHPQQDAQWLIEPAFRRLESLMNHPGQPVRTDIIPCPGIVAGESTATIAVDDFLVREAETFIESSYLQGINVPDVIDYVKCSRRTLERRFSEALKMSIHDYLLRLRVKNALCHLRTPRNPNWRTLPLLPALAVTRPLRKASVKKPA